MPQTFSAAFFLLEGHGVESEDVMRRWIICCLWIIPTQGVTDYEDYVVVTSLLDGTS
jgi:hypothetical protein